MGTRQELLWTEKYRPSKLEDMALDTGVRRVLASYLEAAEIPHLLLVGPSGSGKTTVARILCASLDCQVRALNASDERGIDVVREKIKSFVVSMLGARWNVVFLDEADAMTSDAQTALRNLIEAYADRARFIFTANLQHKIIGAIQSRCQILQMGRPPLKERYKVLASVLEAEEIEAEPQILLSYAERYPDMRRMLWAAQLAWFAEGVLLTAAPEIGDGGPALFKLVEEKNWTALLHLSATGGFDHEQALRGMFYAVPDEHPKAGFLRHVLGRGVHESGFTPDPVVLFLAVCAEAMEGLE